MCDEYNRFVFSKLIHFFRHPTDVLRNDMSVSHTHQRAGVETQKQDAFMLEFKAFAAEYLTEGSTTGVAPFGFMVTEDHVILCFQ